MITITLDVIRVFTAHDGSGGNALGVFLDGAAIARERRQGIAAGLGFAETVFVDAVADGVVSIFTPEVELAFAGHPTVGTAWLLAERGMPTPVLRPPAGEVATWRDGALTWIRARAQWVHPITFVELVSPTEVDALSGPPAGEESWYAWAWIDEASGVVRSRFFFTGAGITEDEATGAAAVLMGDRLGRPLEIRQGRGSVLYARPGPDGTIEVGGRCVYVESRRMRI